ncbi:hypothetical protein [Spirosoma sp. KUDC1026]|uniref:hypothetical protein n=1 Tax=Spirosoma sp. KUDC1026 TaxID=2745947 RepID=UPI00159BC659|nr:hypothetical protein [Spirosoma sp. KUDC1026]QKZ13853.1 hypothetical protein HU175_14915 [Spirosoma sp. KUDC1026]
MEQASFLTVSQVVNALHQQGFLTIFRLDANQLTCSAGTFSADEFDIVELYRVRGNAPETGDMIVCAIRSSLKGILITRCDTSGKPTASLLQMKQPSL